MARDGGTMDADMKAFLALEEARIGPWTAARAAERDLAIPSPALPGVIDNITLLRSQSALFLAALGEHAGEPPETFQP